jgi:hypothetical protein
MGHLILWDNQDHTVVLQQYTSGAVKDDLYSLAQKSAALLSGVPYTVHIIVDETQRQLVLNGADIKYLEKVVPPNQGTVVVVYGDGSLEYKRIVQATGRQLAPKAFGNTYFAPTLEKARQILQETCAVHYP